MSAAATATALEKPAELSEARALEILNAMPYLVAASNNHLKSGLVLSVPYEVHEDKLSYVFPEQPFCIMRRITKSEYLKALPRQMRHTRIVSRYYYEIATD